MVARGPSSCIFLPSSSDYIRSILSSFFLPSFFAPFAVGASAHLGSYLFWLVTLQDTGLACSDWLDRALGRPATAARTHGRHTWNLDSVLSTFAAVVVGLFDKVN